ncbi:VOC family protein [Dactylosporangium sp. NPDC000555]|uniref:VOC family protein n=1 Tax=Dactylosporangium sp. NPDC000555 TaxID=3154260 RepID=UPI0033194294
MPATEIRFDHLMVAVADLEAAGERYRDLGFEVRTGGRHANLGTENLIIPFRRERYIELIAVRDVASTRRNLEQGDRFVDLLERYDELPMIFVLRVSDLPGVRARLDAADIATLEPHRLSRTGPDGRTVSFGLLSPASGPWRRGFPSFIDWGSAPQPAATAGEHPNGAVELSALDVLVDDVETHVRYYRSLGLAVSALAGQDLATVDLDGLRLRLVGPAAQPGGPDTLSAHGPGVTAVRLAGRADTTVPAQPRRPFVLNLVAEAAG